MPEQEYICDPSLLSETPCTIELSETDTGLDVASGLPLAQIVSTELDYGADLFETKEVWAKIDGHDINVDVLVMNSKPIAAWSSDQGCTPIQIQDLTDDVTVNAGAESLEEYLKQFPAKSSSPLSVDKLEFLDNPGEHYLIVTHSVLGVLAEIHDGEVEIFKKDSHKREDRKGPPDAAPPSAPLKQFSEFDPSLLPSKYIRVIPFPAFEVLEDRRGRLKLCEAMAPLGEAEQPIYLMYDQQSEHLRSATDEEIKIKPLATRISGRSRHDLTAKLETFVTTYKDNSRSPGFPVNENSYRLEMVLHKGQPLAMRLGGKWLPLSDSANALLAKELLEWSLQASNRIVR